LSSKVLPLAGTPDFSMLLLRGFHDETADFMCRRRSIVVSRSGAMIDRRMALFAHLHVSRQAKPEMRRLAIARERHLMTA
jgi:hypothetical protein